MYNSDTKQNVKKKDLNEMIMTDTIPLSEEANNSKTIRVLSVDELLAETIRRIVRSDSVSSLFID